MQPRPPSSHEPAPATPAIAAQLLFVGPDGDQLAKETLERAPEAGCHVASTAREALALVERFPLHAVVCTIGGAEGRRLFQAVGARHPGVLRVLVGERHGLTLDATVAAPYANAFVKRDGVMWLPSLVTRMLGLRLEAP
jgi:hypothetical protein